MMDFNDLQSIVRRCTEPQAPNLYRNLYGMEVNAPALHITGEDRWRALPLLTKDALLNTPLKERCFAGNADIDHIRVSSGTSGKPPLFSPRTAARGIEYRLTYHDFSGAILAYTTPAMPHWHEALQESLGHSPRVITYDPKNPEISIQLAEIARVDAISVFTFHMHTIGTLMLKAGMAEQIRFIEMCGEVCTRALFEYLRNTFPNAVILPQYGSGEVENIPMGIPCHAITGEEPLSVYHVKDTHYHELLNPETEEIIPRVAGAEGELVLTSYPGEPAALPLIRYRTGDIVRILDTRCATHDDLVFTVLGRAQADFLKVPGGMLRADEIERTLRMLSDFVTDRFELHLYQQAASSGPGIRAVMHVELLESAPQKDLTLMAQKISQLMRIGPSRTYGKAVAEGALGELTCVALSTARSKGKHKRMVSHLQ
jgi:phenylacetate-coenzyme A ligase PaaK-like adenylate-forming protein